MRSKPVTLFLVLCITSAQTSFLRSQETTPTASANTKQSSSDLQEAALQAIRDSSKSFVTAFGAGDAKAIAGLWTEDAEYIDDAGQRFVGRDAIEACYAELFKEHPGTSIRVAIDSLRVISDLVAIEDGRVLSESGSEQLGFTQYTATHVKVGGKWLMASVRDHWVDSPPEAQSAADLQWLVGDWEAEEYGVQTHAHINWAVSDRFLERRYTIEQADGSQSTGVQMIGWNPITGQVQSWDFSPGGGHAVSAWTPTQDGWLCEAMGVTGSGVPTAAINLLKRLDDNAFVWQSIQRSLGDVALNDTEEVVIKRQTSSPSGK